MDILDHLITLPWLLIGHLFFWPILIFAGLTAPWNKVSGRMKHIWPGLCAGLLIMWQLKAGLAQGISIHLLGATLMTVLFGRQLAIVGMSVVLVGTSLIMTFNGYDSWLALGLNGIISILLPVYISYQIVRLVFLYLPHNFFIYIFLSGFANAMFTTGVVGVTSTVILLMTSTMDSNFLLHNYLPAYLLIIFPEAFITGGVLTLFVVYKPQWVLSFDDDLYLKKS